MTPEQQKALALARARRRRADAQGQPDAPPERGFLHAIGDNLIGFDDGVDSLGERFGRVAGDIGSAGIAGLARGAAGLAGLPGSVGDLVDAGMTRAGQAVGVIPDDWEAPQSSLSGGSLIGGLSDLTGGATDFRGDTAAGRIAGTAAEFVPGALAFGGGTAANALRYGAVPGAASEVAGMATEGTAAEPYARVAAALLAAPAVNALESGARRVISPYGGADAGRASLAQVLDDAGVPVSAGQRVGNDALRRREGLTSAGQAMNESQREALTSAALRTAGTNAKRATPEVLRDTASRIGQVFDDVVRGVDVVPDAASAQALTNANNTYKTLAPKLTQAPIVGQVSREFDAAFRSGRSIPASTLQSWRSNLSKLTTSSDNATRQAAIEALGAVDDALSSTLASLGRADDVARLATAREQYRNFLAIQRAATGAGEMAATGVLSPSALRNAVVQQGRSGFAQGTRGDLADLSRAAEGVMRPLPTSGTAENLRAMGVPSVASTGLGAGIGSAIAGPAGAAIGGAAGAVTPSVARALMMSGPGQNYLSNQLVSPGGPIFDPRAFSPVAAALSGSGARST